MTPPTLPASEHVPVAVARILARDDLLRLARDAEAAVGIVNESKASRRVWRHETDIFSEALYQYHEAARNTDSPTVRLNAWDRAGVIVRFCRLLGVHLEPPDEVDDLTTFHHRLLAELDGARDSRTGHELDRDLFDAVVVRHRAIRDIRIGGDPLTAVALANRPDRDFVGTGADFYRADYQVEIGVALLLSGQAAQVRPMLRESETGFWQAVKANRFSSRHRIHYLLALVTWVEGDLPQAAVGLSRSYQHLRQTSRHPERHDIEQLHLSLARAELIVAGGDRSMPVVNEAVELLDDAIHATERIRDRWKVISRSRSPLSVAFRRIYGDIARAAAALPGRQAAELGLRTALAAKQTGFASRIRADRSSVDKVTLKGRRLRSLIDLVVAAEAESTQPALGDATSRDTQQNLDDLRAELQEAVSPMLADTVLPLPANVARLIDAVGDRYALDYVGLPDTLTGQVEWFRTLIEPSGAIAFAQLAVGAELGSFLAAIRHPAAELGTTLAAGPDWLALGSQLLAPQLRQRLALATEEEPIELVISAHSALSLMPWAALKISERTRLLHRAVITQTPVLTCLSGAAAGPVSGPALVQLVTAGRDERSIGVKAGQERRAWGIRPENGRTPLSECALESFQEPVEVPGTFAAALADETNRWRFAHVASHGSGTGLDQTLDLPGAPISAGRALTLPWPQSVLMASCHVGRLVNVADAEPLNFVVALLASGSECVVACIDEVDDVSTGRIAATIVRDARRGGVRLDLALRSAQLPRVRYPEALWALITAYVR